ncbi:TPA: hypothetical protein MB315_004555 [Klebsiella quasipneumoniae subsp. similipneumoniae]|nr:hypothetical protein [Klebsiella quasipneumoniae subsp. similipneumoniae]
MEKIILITQDFILHTALHHYIDSIVMYQDMDDLVNSINRGNAELTYQFIIDNRYPFSESVKVEKALKLKNINARFLVIQISNIAYHILGYSHYFHVTFVGNFSKSIQSIISFVEKNDVSSETRLFNRSVISVFEIELLKLFLYEKSISSVANKMNMPVKKVYLYRELLYKKLGLPNFNQAFLYMLKHYPGHSINEKALKVVDES